MILVSKSSDYLKLYPDNSNVNFKTRLFNRITIEKDTKFYLRELILPPLETADIVYIYSNCISHVSVGDKWRRLLKVLPLEVSENYQRFEFSNPFGFEISCPYLEEIRLAFKDSSEAYVKFKKDTHTIAVIEIK